MIEDQNPIIAACQNSNGLKELICKEAKFPIKGRDEYY